MTTQHSAEELAEAVAFFFDLAEPDAAYRITCGAWLIVEVGLFGAASGALDLVRHVLATRRT